MDVLEELALRGGGIPDDADVDVSPELYALGRLLVDASEEHEENPALHLRAFEFPRVRKGPEHRARRVDSIGVCLEAPCRPRSKHPSPDE